jgi:hypothetical protein
MANIYVIQFVGVMLATAGLIALMVSTHLFGRPMSPAEKRKASDEWNRSKSTYSLPINLEAIASLIFFFGGIGILIWSRFSLCAFLAYWLPPLPVVVRILLSCT